MSGESNVARWAPKVRLVSILIAVVAFLMIARTLPISEMVAALRGWVEELGVWGPVAFAVVYVVATVLMLPASLLTIAAGTIFGLALGTAVVSVGATTGAACAFLIGRYLLRDRVARMMASRPKLKAVDDAIDEGGWKIVALLRLSPAIPFNLQNYLYGLTPVGFWPCTLASWVAMLPGTFLYVYIGYTAGQVVGGGRERSIWEWLALAVGLLATVAVTVYVTRLAKRKLDERTQVDEVAAPAEVEAQAAAAGFPTGALVSAAIALLLAGVAVYVQANPDALRNLLAPVLPAA